MSFLYSSGDGLLICLLAFDLQDNLRQAVRAFFAYMYRCIVADSHSRELMEWARQFVMSIIYHYIGELISRISVG